MKKIILAGIMAGMVMATITGYGNTVNVMAASSGKKAAKTEKDKDEKKETEKIEKGRRYAALNCSEHDTALNEKVNAIYYHGGQSVLKNLSVVTSATAASKSTIVVNGVKEGAKWYYVTAATQAALEAVTAGTAITKASWTELTANGLEITPTSGHKYIRVVDVDSADKPLAVGDAILSIGE